VKRKKGPVTDAALLRSRAEAKLKQTMAEAELKQTVAEDEEAAKRAPAPEELDARRLLYELEVHQIELQMQNEELQIARIDAETALARYTELFDFAPVSYVVLDPEEIVREINHSGARLLGRDRARLVGTDFSAVLDSAHQRIFSAVVLRTLTEEGRQSCEVELATDDEGSRILILTLSAITWPEKLVLVAFEDVTEQRRREQQLLQTEAALRESERRKDEFLAVLSHELRNPLNAIRASTYLHARVPPGSENSRKAMGIIDRQVTHLARLVDDLLDVTRITRGKVRLKLSVLDLGELARRVMDDQVATFEADGLELEGRFEAGPFWIKADPARVTQSIANVLANADKFTPRMGRVVVSLRREGTQAVLRVRDTGVGIAPEVLEHLFEPFAQAPQSLDRTRGGLGIGLAMVSGLVELQGGTVTIHSEGLGRGAEVTIRFPLVAPPNRVEAPVASAPARKRRILIIEDNMDSADALAEALRVNGHEVQHAYNGRVGLELAKGFAPEILLCDVGLPGMDGYAVARAFRADPDLKDVWLIALTGYAQADDVQRALQAGFSRHLAKPFDPELLGRLLDEAP
jgi:PAS domain S-box-containing protein